MGAKKWVWSPIKEILFTYLAISKILYWFNTIIAMNQSDLESVGVAVLNRLLYQDILLISGVILFFFLDKHIHRKRSKSRKILEHILFYGVGYVALMAVTLIYFLVMRLVFGPFEIDWGSLFGYTFVAYIVVAIVLNIKDYFKAKSSSGYASDAQSTDDKLAMLKALHNDGILTQDEFNQKKEKLDLF